MYKYLIQRCAKYLLSRLLFRYALSNIISHTVGGRNAFGRLATTRLALSRQKYLECVWERIEMSVMSLDEL